jgi:DNA-binding MarR family transcriptional regulator
MDETIAMINKLIVEVFNDILRLEENTLRAGAFNDVSITEIHTVDAIGLYTQLTTSEVAKKLKITAGTLTVAINNLVKKDYVKRIRSEDDRRVVKLGLTGKGRVLYRVHEKFHAEMIRESIAHLDGEEEEVLLNVLSNLHKFLTQSLTAIRTNLEPVAKLEV